MQACPAVSHDSLEKQIGSTIPAASVWTNPFAQDAQASRYAPPVETKKQFGNRLHHDFIVELLGMVEGASERHPDNLKIRVDGMIDKVVEMRQAYMDWVQRSPQEQHPIMLGDFDEMLESLEVDRHKASDYRRAIRRFWKALNKFYDEKYVPGFLRS